MNQPNVMMCNFLNIGIHRKGDDRAGLLFRSKHALYRITTIENAGKLVKELNFYGSDLKKRKAALQYLLPVYCPRKRAYVLEIALNHNKVLFQLFELKGQATALAFKWEGKRTELLHTFANFSILTFMTYKS